MGSSSKSKSSSTEIANSYNKTLNTNVESGIGLGLADSTISGSVFAQNSGNTTASFSLGAGSTAPANAPQSGGGFDIEKYAPYLIVAAVFVVILFLSRGGKSP